MFVNGVLGWFSSKLVFIGVKVNVLVKVKFFNFFVSKFFFVIGVYYIWKLLNRFFCGCGRIV